MGSFLILYKWLRKQIEEIIEAIKSGKLIEYIKKKFFELIGDNEGLRKLAYNNFVKAISKENLDEIIQHIFEGDFGISRIGRKKIFSAKGMHSIFGVNKRIVKIIEETEIPPKLLHGPDTFFKAKVQLKYKNGEWIDKIDNGGYTSFFPASWKKDRIIEEIAFAWENRKVIDSTRLFELTGRTTTGQEILFIERNNEIKTIFPILD